MSGFLVITSGAHAGAAELDQMIESIDLSKRLDRMSSQSNGSCFAVSSQPNAPLRGKRLFETDRWIILFSGDVIDHESAPFGDIIARLESGETSYFAELNGTFGVAAYDKERRRLFVVSDRRSQLPIFYYADSDYLHVSTDLATFCRSKIDIRFNEEWLWEYLYFNYPIGDATFLRDVRRMPPASILEYDLNGNGYSIHRYAELFRKADHLLDGEEALDMAADVFSRRVPQYFEGSGDVACALTGGWDGRTMLALAPRKDITAYTYGVPGCHDLEGGGRTAQLAGIRHIGILFDDAFTSDLARLMLETVFLSSGLQGVLRATLLYAYGLLTDEGRRFPLTISGLSMDMQFRGHACAPALISDDAVTLFEGGGRTAKREDRWSSLFRADFASFRERIAHALDSLERDFGAFDDTAHHLSYILYVLSPQYFCGEIKIADRFTTVRVPCWDAEIIDLSYSIRQSTLSFSQFSPHTRGDISELVLQSYLLHELAPRFARTPIGNTRPDIVLKGRGMYQLYRIYRGIRGRVGGLFGGRKGYAPLEDWDAWLNEHHREFIDGLIFSGDSRIRNYVRDEYLETLKGNRDTHYIGKLATLEIILRLIESGWKRFW